MNIAESEPVDLPFDFTGEVPPIEFDIAEDSPHLMRNRNVALLPAHFKRYFSLFEQYRAGVRRSHGNTVGDKLTNVGAKPDTRPLGIVKMRDNLRAVTDYSCEATAHPWRTTGKRHQKPRFYTTADVGELLGVTFHKVAAWRKSGVITSDTELSTMKQIRFNADVIDEMIETGQLPPVKSTAENQQESVSKSITQAQQDTVMRETYSSKQVADLCGISAQTVGGWQRHGRIPKTAVVEKSVYCKQTIDKLIASGKLPVCLDTNTTSTSQELVETVADSTYPSHVKTEVKVTESVQMRDGDEYRHFKGLVDLLVNLEGAIMPLNLTIHSVEFVKDVEKNSFKLNNFKFIKKS